jgi:HD-like signal output (HDOD) protein
MRTSTHKAAEIVVGDRIECLDTSTLIDALKRDFASPRYRPPALPAVAMEILQLASRPDVQFGDVAKMLDRDPVLAARVLSIAQSAAYAGRSKVLSLPQAAIRLGLKTLRDLVLEAALHVKVFRVPGYDDVMARLYTHSTAAAHVMRAVCKRTKVPFEYAFLAGLLHDIGIAAGLLAVVNRPELKGLPFDVIQPALNAVHAQASGDLAKRWGFPEPLQVVVRHHHEVQAEGEARLPSAALIVAHQLCWEAGAGMAPPPPELDAKVGIPAEPAPEGLDVHSGATLVEACSALELDEAALRAARAEAFEIVGALGSKGAEARVA